MVVVWRGVRSGLLLALLILVSGCGGGSIAGSYPVTWEKPGVADEELRTEFGLCGGSFDRYGEPRFRPAEFDALDGCMRAKGFVTVEL